MFSLVVVIPNRKKVVWVRVKKGPKKRVQVYREWRFEETSCDVIQRAGL